MSKKESPIPTDQELKVLAIELIVEQGTMTLATAKGNVAWAAPVYYVYLKSCFYFFSDPDSRHVRESLEGGQASSAIYAPASTWKEIRGIQMSGSIKTVNANVRAMEAVKAYLNKFAFTKDFFTPGQQLDLTAFSKRFRVKLYRFKPALVYYMDNGIRFGFRKKIIV